ncbi:MAG TPA: GspE/PulE family protein [Candidatus Nitrosotenuis sp.]|jgi:type IV pilus assembly protein PilB|nr:GspE/PulE family protein [Candidatus Nitrosotenuis sp.]
MHKALIESLAEAGLLDLEKARAVMVDKPDSPTPLCQSMVEAGLIGETELALFLSQYCGLPYTSVSGRKIPTEVLRLLPSDVAEKACMVALERENGRLTLAVADPFDITAQDVARQRTGLELNLMVAARSEILAAIHGRAADISNEMSSFLEQFRAEEIEFLAALEEEEKEAGPPRHDAPLIQMVNALIVDAIQMKASDIHVEPQEGCLRVRYRIDGVLRNMCELPRELQSAVLSRLKLAAGMDISERRRPQDGRARIRVGGRVVDLRVSSMPSFYGEMVVLRVLDRAVGLPTLEQLGFLPHDLERFRRLLANSQGILLITGPTGSGKTSTLYASLNHLNNIGQNIVTIEDPIEFQLAGIGQTQVNPRAGVVFSNALRTILRQDPDIIMVGEIRDVETAQVAVQAAQTGHLVLSTLHTNSAPATLTRLGQMGVAPYETASSLLGVTAQRLVRRICPHCQVEVTPPASLLDYLAEATGSPLPGRYWQGQGCELCASTGFQGRCGLFEILSLSAAVKDLLFRGAPETEVEKAARREGMHTLLEDGLLKVAAGITSLSEVMRVVSITRLGEESPRL